MPEGTSNQPQSSAPSIQTMRDDLAVAKSQPRPPVPPAPQATATAAPRPTPTPVSSIDNPSPLRIPAESAKKKGGKGLIVFLLLLLLLVGAGGVAAWYFLLGGAASPGSEEVSQEPRSLEEVVPSNFTLLARYNLTSGTDKQALLSAWQAVVVEPPSMRSFLEGNPTLILQESSAQEFSYVLLPGDPRFYVVVPATDEVRQLVAQRSNVQAKELGGGWMVLHSFSTTPFEEQLASHGGVAPTNVGQGLSMTMSPEFINTLPAEVRNALSNRAAASFTLSINPATGLVTFAESSLQATTQAIQAQDPAALLGALPASAKKVVIGPNFSVFSSQAAAPADQQFVSDLSGPFAYYEGLGADGLPEVGLAIELSPEMAQTLKLGDGALERASLSLLNKLGQVIPPATAAFADGTYNDIPLRYINIDRASEVAVDYTIIEEYLLIATSREGMFSLIDAIRGQVEGFTASELWSSLIQGAASPARFGPVEFMELENQVLGSLLPKVQQDEPMRVWATVEQNAAGPSVRGQIKL